MRHCRANNIKFMSTHSFSKKAHLIISFLSFPSLTFLMLPETKTFQSRIYFTILACPPSMTITRLHCRTTSKRCVMTSIVQLVNSAFRHCWICCAVLLSMAAVASSRIKICTKEQEKDAAVSPIKQCNMLVHENIVGRYCKICKSGVIGCSIAIYKNCLF